MKKYSLVRCTLGMVAVLLTAASLSAGPWAFNPDTGEGGVNKADVMNALGTDMTPAEAQGLVFTCVDTVDGCTRQRELKTWVRTSGNGQKVTGFWFVGYLSNDSACGSSAAAGADATLYVNGVPVH